MRRHVRFKELLFCLESTGTALFQGCCAAFQLLPAPLQKQGLSDSSSTALRCSLLVPIFQMIKLRLGRAVTSRHKALYTGSGFYLVLLLFVSLLKVFLWNSHWPETQYVTQPGLPFTTGVASLPPRGPRKVLRRGNFQGARKWCRDPELHPVCTQVTNHLRF